MAPKKQFTKTMQNLYTSLEPLLEMCRENENLVYFLLKRRSSIDALMHPGYLRDFFHKIHPQGLETLGEKMCDQYHGRGFIAQIPEFKLLLVELLHG